jgi:predicted DNA-binding transcriptional regulator AlpA
MITATKERDILADDEAAEVLGGVKVQTLAVWRMQGRGPKFIRLGRLIRYRRRDLEAWLEANTVETK